MAILIFGLKSEGVQNSCGVTKERRKKKNPLSLLCALLCFRSRQGVVGTCRTTILSCFFLLLYCTAKCYCSNQWRVVILHFFSLRALLLPLLHKILVGLLVKVTTTAVVAGFHKYLCTQMLIYTIFTRNYSKYLVLRTTQLLPARQLTLA